MNSMEKKKTGKKIVQIAYLCKISRCSFKLLGKVLMNVDLSIT